MNPDTHALAGAYAVNAVTDEERRSFEIHLDLCEDCRAEVAELQAAAAAMAVDVELPPPPPMRASVLAAISQTRQLSPIASATQGETGQSAPTASSTSVEPSPVSPTATPSPAPVDELSARRRLRVQPWLAAAAAAAVFAVGGAVWQPWNDQPEQLTATEQVLRSDDAQRVDQPMNGSQITIVRSPSHKKAVLVADSMPAAPFGKAYQLWFDMPGRGMVSAGLVKGSGAVTIPLQGDATVATGAGITLEPASGSDKPTSDPVALFSFA
ncbi:MULTISPECIES: anti-sigma factor domain-containing protein [unclassified Knoellia]|uniref:anti-sigma factor n=1 Tax=Knoellia altitudinis TaxID=3404795 RepID=UPI00360C2208